MAERLRASCLCGGVAFTVPSPLGPVTACHCSQCRKTSGHIAASFDVAEAALRFSARGTERSYTLPGGATRGFCGTCGATLWFRSADGFAVEAGLIDGPTGTRLEGHIFTADKGDYYDIADGLPQDEGWTRD